MSAIDGWLPSPPPTRRRPDQFPRPFAGRGAITPGRARTDPAAGAYVDELAARTGVPLDRIMHVRAARGVDYLTVLRYNQRGKPFVRRGEVAANVIPVLRTT